jgi:putative ABC transport system permease protein
VARLTKALAPDDHTPTPDPENVVAVGTDFGALSRMYPSWRIQGGVSNAAGQACAIGTHIAAQMHLHLGDAIQLDTVTSGASQSATFPIASILSTGTAQDDQIFVPLASLQSMSRLPGKLSVVEMIVPGDTTEIERGMVELNQLLSGISGVEVRPIRQIVYSAGRVLDTIRWVMLSLTGLILIIIALCVTATMTAIVLERRKDIAVMKSLGANDRLVMRLFLSEGATMGLLGGCGGFALGLLLAHEMARQLFGVSLSPTWWTFPLVCFASMILAAGATLFPVEIVRGIQPARVLRGD